MEILYFKLFYVSIVIHFETGFEAFKTAEQGVEEESRDVNVDEGNLHCFFNEKIIYLSKTSLFIAHSDDTSLT